MRIALGSDERTDVTDAVAADLRARGHEVVLVGPPAALSGEQMASEEQMAFEEQMVSEEQHKQWAQVGREVGELVAGGACGTAVLFCWTGTGASIAANKVRGVRAALCTDAETAAGARTWNDANVLVMGLRRTTPESAREILDAWFSTEPDPDEAANIASLDA